MQGILCRLSQEERALAFRLGRLPAEAGTWSGYARLAAKRMEAARECIARGHSARAADLIDDAGHLVRYAEAADHIDRIRCAARAELNQPTIASLEAAQ